MRDHLQEIKKLIDNCSEDERKALRAYLHAREPHKLEEAWGIDADILLTAIENASDLTKRGVRGIIAEAVFVSEVVPSVAHIGWHESKIKGEDRSYDALLKKGEITARIQVKLQRLERSKPKLYYPNHFEHGTLYVVEVQKTRTGEKRTKLPSLDTVTKLTTTESVTVQTRPYSFGDFDILAVNMHPSTDNWRSFRYTVASWLLARPHAPGQIAIFQPVAAAANELWTDDLSVCLKWFESGEQRKVLADLAHLRKKTKVKRPT